MNWPPRSPDLNPIEHLWDVLEKGMKAHHTTPATLTELWTALADVWQAIPVEHFRKLVESMSPAAPPPAAAAPPAAAPAPDTAPAPAPAPAAAPLPPPAAPDAAVAPAPAPAVA
ncbi:hypothetical protein AVEN_141712-1 [Araneus ventricosus]|uniref:Tc1-like transposase DDE domain-containing protein n=1 Tax=Araneus ventricosus TaxID=182803 RepID=A0A4Y2QGX4_ARAVE|nr:hypothetical protein AVEN_40861-1 [Araneus ventricosus]GBN63206.1 hypothetical protein AVEN_141712-1 [Araneus ventricosus]